MRKSPDIGAEWRLNFHFTTEMVHSAMLTMAEKEGWYVPMKGDTVVGMSNRGDKVTLIVSRREAS